MMSEVHYQYQLASLMALSRSFPRRATVSFEQGNGIVKKNSTSSANTYGRWTSFAPAAALRFVVDATPFFLVVPKESNVSLLSKRWTPRILDLPVPVSGRIVDPVALQQNGMAKNSVLLARIEYAFFIEIPSFCCDGPM